MDISDIELIHNVPVLLLFNFRPVGLNNVQYPTIPTRNHDHVYTLQFDYVTKCNKLKHVIGNVLFKNSPKWSSKNVNENTSLKTDSDRFSMNPDDS